MSAAPIYFMLAVWGETYLDAMCRHLLGSMLTPGNLGRLSAADGHRFLVATTAADWQRLQAYPEVEAASRHVTFELVEIPERPANLTVYAHMTNAHAALLTLAGERGCYGCMLTPDAYLSENFVSVLLDHRARGTEVLLISGWHTAERAFFAELRARGLSSPSAPGTPPSPRDRIAPGIGALVLGQLCATTMHSCVGRMEWDSAAFDDTATFVWWRLPGEPGLLLHCMFWVEMGLDYSRIGDHSIDALKISTIEAMYVQDNFGVDAKIAVIADGSEAFQSSWKEDDLIAENMPRMSREQYLRPKRLQQVPLIGGFLKGVQMRSALRRATSERRDRIKMRLFFQPVVWGRKGTDSEVEAIERRVQRVLSMFVGDFRPGHAGWCAGLVAPWFLLLDVCVGVLRAWRRLQQVYWPRAVEYLRVIGRALSGDAAAREKILRRLHRAGRMR